MEISFQVETPGSGPDTGAVTVGWFLTQDKGAVLFDPPERMSVRQTNKSHAKSAARCPAVIQMESRYFVVKCPFDLHIGFDRDEAGKPRLINRAGATSPIRGSKIGEVLTLVNETEWRFAERPTLQLKLPYCFIADESVFLTQLAPFAHYRADPLPGTIFGGRFPLNLWPRPLMWAFEWHDTGKDLILQRGEPLFYCQFETNGPERPVQLVEAERTAELETYMEKISGVVNYVNQTYGLFKAAEALRPAKLLHPKAQGNLPKL